MPATIPNADSKRRKTLGDVLPEDATCAHCKYSLKGLRSGGRCPECGTPIAFRLRRFRLDDTLTDAYPPYLKSLALGCWLMFVGALLTGGLATAARVTFNPAVAGASGITGLLWWAGVWIVMRPRQTPAVPRSQAEKEWVRCRWFARLSQVGWAVGGIGLCGMILSIRTAMAAAAMNVLPYSPTPAVRAFESIAYLGNFTGLIGLVPLCVVVAGLSDWAGHTVLGDRLRTSAYLLTFGILAVALALPVALARKATIFGPTAFIIYTVLVLGSIAFIIGKVMLLLSFARLASMSLWAINNAETRAESDRRIAERRHRFTEAIGERSSHAGAGPVPPPVNPVQGRGTRDGTKGPEPETYALAPEDPDPA